jgi:hypothetical protein
VPESHEVRFYLVHKGDSVEIAAGEIVIGRDVPCHLRFNDPSVSRRHARIVRRRDEAFVEDLGSTNGTLVNGQPASGAVKVGNGDIIGIGMRELSVSVVDDEVSEPPTITLRELSAVVGARTTRLVTAPVRVPEVAGAPAGAATQRCPRCGATVSREDDTCAACHYEWGTFRMRSPTVETANVLARRGPARLAIELHVLYVSPELEVEATTRDLSLTGVLVCSQVLDPVGTKCELTILADAMPSLQVGGVVRRVVVHERPGGGPVGMGVEFARVGTAERSWLETVIGRVSPTA